MFLEGYDVGKYYITLVISLIVTLTCGVRGWVPHRHADTHMHVHTCARTHTNTRTRSVRHVYYDMVIINIISKTRISRHAT